MNSSEQKQHATRTNELTKMVEDLATVVEDQLGMIERLRGTVNDERTHRLKTIDEDRAYVDEKLAGMYEEFHKMEELIAKQYDVFKLLNARFELLLLQTQTFQKRAFVERIMWLLLGR